jgi:hypothetical protein
MLARLPANGLRIHAAHQKGTNAIRNQPPHNPGIINPVKARGGVARGAGEGEEVVGASMAIN